MVPSITIGEARDRHHILLILGTTLFAVETVDSGGLYQTITTHYIAIETGVSDSSNLVECLSNQLVEIVYHIHTYDLYCMLFLAYL